MVSWQSYCEYQTDWSYGDSAGTREYSRCSAYSTFGCAGEHNVYALTRAEGHPMEVSWRTTGGSGCDSEYTLSTDLSRHTALSRCLLGRTDTAAPTVPVSSNGPERLQICLLGGSCRECPAARRLSVLRT